MIQFNSISGSLLSSLVQLVTFLFLLIFLLNRCQIIVIIVILVLELSSLSIDNSNLISPISFLHFLSIINLYLRSLSMWIYNGRSLYTRLVNYSSNLFQFLLKYIMLVIAFDHVSQVRNWGLNIC